MKKDDLVNNVAFAGVAPLLAKLDKDGVLTDLLNNKSPSQTTKDYGTDRYGVFKLLKLQKEKGAKSAKDFARPFAAAYCNGAHRRGAFSTAVYSGTGDFSAGEVAEINKRVNGFNAKFGDLCAVYNDNKLQKKNGDLHANTSVEKIAKALQKYTQFFATKYSSGAAETYALRKRIAEGVSDFHIKNYKKLYSDCVFKNPHKYKTEADGQWDHALYMEKQAFDNGPCVNTDSGLAGMQDDRAASMALDEERLATDGATDAVTPYNEMKMTVQLLLQVAGYRGAEYQFQDFHELGRMMASYDLSRVSALRSGPANLGAVLGYSNVAEFDEECRNLEFGGSVGANAVVPGVAGADEAQDRKRSALEKRAKCAASRQALGLKLPGELKLSGAVAADISAGTAKLGANAISLRADQDDLDYKELSYGFDFATYRPQLNSPDKIPADLAARWAQHLATDAALFKILESKFPLLASNNVGDASYPMADAGTEHYAHAHAAATATVADTAATGQAADTSLATVFDSTGNYAEQQEQQNKKAKYVAHFTRACAAVCGGRKRAETLNDAAAIATDEGSAIGDNSGVEDEGDDLVDKAVCDDQVGNFVLPRPVVAVKSTGGKLKVDYNLELVNMNGEDYTMCDLFEALGAGDP